MTTLKDLTEQELKQYYRLVKRVDGRSRQEKNRHTPYDLKKAYHVVRLMGEIEQILMEGTLELDRNREQLKSIRRGEWTKEGIEQYFTDKERQLEELYLTSELPKQPDEAKIKEVLLQCLEIAYDDVGDIVHVADKEGMALKEILEVIQRHGLVL